MKLKRIILSVLVFSFAFVLPILVFAGPNDPNYTIGSNATVADVFNWGSYLLIKVIVPFLFALATAAFIYGVIEYYLNPGNEEKRKKGKSFIMGGLIALFLMLSAWGIVTVLTNTFGVDRSIPQLPGTGDTYGEGTIINNDGSIN